MNSSLHCLILILMFGGASGDSVEQTGQKIVLEGASVTLDCNYTSKEYPAHFWYVQYPNKGLQFLQRETIENRKSFGARNIKERISSIVKDLVQVSDSGVYYCLLRDTSLRMQEELYKNLLGPHKVCTEAGNPDWGASFSPMQTVLLGHYEKGEKSSTGASTSRGTELSLVETGVREEGL